jgi:hypothetical protein
MQTAPLAALDLPLKVLVWAHGDQTRLSYTPPSTLAARYDLGEELTSRLAGIEPAVLASPLWSITANSFIPFAATSSDRRATVSATNKGLSFVTT